MVMVMVMVMVVMGAKTNNLIDGSCTFSAPGLQLSYQQPMPCRMGIQASAAVAMETATMASVGIGRISHRPTSLVKH